MLDCGGVDGGLHRVTGSKFEGVLFCCFLMNDCSDNNEHAMSWCTD